MSETIEAIYSPETGRIACVLLQAAWKADARIARLFPGEDWDTAPKDTMRRMSATLDQWRQIAAMPRDKRIARFQKSSAAKA